ncbi:MAG: ATP-binding protein [Bacteroidota bacterium]
MFRIPLKKDLLWLFIGYFCLAVSSGLYIYDIYNTDERLVNKLVDHVESSLERCINQFSNNLPPDPECISCTLEYDPYKNLYSWTNTPFLPAQKRIESQETLPNHKILNFDGRRYYQIRRREKGRIKVILLPLSIEYPIVNDFLTPFIYLGKYYDRLNSDQLRALDVSDPEASGEQEARSVNHITIHDPEGLPLYKIKNFDPIWLRKTVRIGVFSFLLLGIVSLLLSSRQFFIDVLQRNVSSNLIFAGIVLMMRFILWQVKLPGNYLDIELFSPSIVAFHTLAPSLGELTLNIFTFALIISIIFQSFYRSLNSFYRKIIQRYEFFSLLIAFLTLFASVYLLSVYYYIFITIVLNSQIELEFSNLFTTDFYSFLILLDAGILLFSVILLLLMLCKFNILLGIKYAYSAWFWLIHMLVVVGLSYSFFEPIVQAGYLLPFHLGSVVLALYILFVVLYRMPFKKIFSYDLTNYVLLVGVTALIITSTLAQGIELSNQADVERIGRQVLQEKLKLIVNYQSSLASIQSNTEEIDSGIDDFRRISDLENWLHDTYIVPKFRGFDTRLFIYPFAIKPDTILLDNVEQTMVIKEMIDESPEENWRLYMLENDLEDDWYIGEIPLFLDSTHNYLLLLTIKPSDIQTEGLYPSLSMDRELYYQIRETQRFDYALYRDKFLYSQNGKTSFPMYLEEHIQDPQALTNSYSRDFGGHREYVAPGDKGQLVAIVRYQQQSFLEVLTRFSIVFYFFTITSLLFILLPLYIIRWQRGEQGVNQIPLRSKIRLTVLVIVILPLLIILGSLSSFVENEFEKETEEALFKSTANVVQLLQSDCRGCYDGKGNLNLGRLSERFEQITEFLSEDITLYDIKGRYISSTQQQIFQTGISTDLMNAEALSAFRDKKVARVVHQEKIGNQTFFAAYQPIMNEVNYPIGFVNVPFLGRQDELNDQILDFLSYFVNTYLIIFLIVNVLAVLISNTITRPLKLIQGRLSTTRLGDYNTKIQYKSNDEIGDIVQAYNSMLDKLSSSEAQLKQNQREKAWRQMAKQVAHEIKNPLTPMKLGIQHIDRAWNDKSVHLDRMFPRFIRTLLSQIDTLSRIANSFSEFAKMPEPEKTEVSVSEVLLEVVDLYASSENTEWNLDIPKDPFWVYADRDQLGRCFQNVIKNGMQAMEEKAMMDVCIRRNGHNTCIIEIRDYGKGMSEEVQEMIFEPNFSTKSSGMGLGLAMVKRIIELSGGKITFESRKGEGTAFFIELPLLRKSL